MILALVCFITYGLFDGFSTIAMLSKGGEDAQMSAINRDFALFIAGEGYPVIPLDPTNTPYVGKGLIANGWDGATTDPVLINKWWDQWPDSVTGIIETNQLHVVRFNVTLGESSGILSYALQHFGISGFFVVKLIVTTGLIAGCVLSTLVYRNIIWLGIMVLLAFSLIGLIAGISNLAVFSSDLVLEHYGITHEWLNNVILVICFVTGIILTMVAARPDLPDENRSVDAFVIPESDAYVMAKYVR